MMESHTEHQHDNKRRKLSYPRYSSCLTSITVQAESDSIDVGLFSFHLVAPKFVPLRWLDEEQMEDTFQKKSWPQIPPETLISDISSTLVSSSSKKKFDKWIPAASERKDDMLDILHIVYDFVAKDPQKFSLDFLKIFKSHYPQLASEFDFEKAFSYDSLTNKIGKDYVFSDVDFGTLQNQIGDAHFFLLWVYLDILAIYDEIAKRLIKIDNFELDSIKSYTRDRQGELYQEIFSSDAIPNDPLVFKNLFTLEGILNCNYRSHTKGHSDFFRRFCSSFEQGPLPSIGRGLSRASASLKQSNIEILNLVSEHHRELLKDFIILFSPLEAAIVYKFAKKVVDV